MPPPLIEGHYGKPMLTQVYNNLPVNREETALRPQRAAAAFHNAHNGAESDGATGAHHFPGTFYGSLWSTTLARRDKIDTGATDRRASGPDGNGGLINVTTKFRELPGTLWAHDHRFFFTAEMSTRAISAPWSTTSSGPDRGNEELNDGVNLRLPSGKFPWKTATSDFTMCYCTP